jgi:hypothetical protein
MVSFHRHSAVMPLDGFRAGRGVKSAPEVLLSEQAPNHPPKTW